MEIRAVLPADFTQIHNLVCQIHMLHVSNRPDVFRDVDPFGREAFDGILADDKSIALAATEGEDVIGYCIITLKEPSPLPIAQRRVVAYMEDLCVDQARRGEGIGRLLCREAETRAREQGAGVLELMAWAFNRPAIDFYEKMGMTIRSCTMEKNL